jgi:hypothetical protein
MKPTFDAGDVIRAGRYDDTQLCQLIDAAREELRVRTTRLHERVHGVMYAVHFTPMSRNYLTDRSWTR